LDNQVKKGQVLADGPSTDQGELALGAMSGGFQALGGYNFEDAIVLVRGWSRRISLPLSTLKNFEVEACDTKQGQRKITRDIPNVGEEALRNLDDSGIIRIGAKVPLSDILVGRSLQKVKRS